MKNICRVGALTLALSFAGFIPARAAETALHVFGGGDGANPAASLIADQKGTLYGTTYGGGSEGYGTVFMLTPPTTSNPASAETALYTRNPAWTETVLYSFTGSSQGYDSRYPMAGLIFGSDGALYGTGNEGGLNGYGTVFRVNPPAYDGAPWTEEVLYDFCGQSDCADGAYPQSRHHVLTCRASSDAD